MQNAVRVLSGWNISNGSAVYLHKGVEIFSVYFIKSRDLKTTKVKYLPVLKHGEYHPDYTEEYIKQLIDETPNSLFQEIVFHPCLNCDDLLSCDQHQVSIFCAKCNGVFDQLIEQMDIGCDEDGNVSFIEFEEGNFVPNKSAFFDRLCLHETKATMLHFKTDNPDDELKALAYETINTECIKIQFGNQLFVMIAKDGSISEQSLMSYYIQLVSIKETLEALNIRPAVD